ncbi:hypothetical protein ABPG77_008216 [Micractinium sp. CCAP 211/92]
MQPHYHSIGRLRPTAAAGTDTSVAAAASRPAAVDITIEPGPNNSRCIWAGIDVAVPAEAVYAALTAYEQLGTFIPGLAENRCLERYADGCRLLQVGKQELGLGLKFRARALLRIREHPAGMPPRLLSRSPNSPRRSTASSKGGGSRGFEPRWPLPLPRGMSPWPDNLSSGWGSSSSGSSSEEEGSWSEWKYLRPRSPLSAPASDISFELVEGDFTAFKGLWRIQPAGDATCRLSYSLFVRPQPWLLVGLIEGRIQGEICANLAAVKAHVERQAGGQTGGGPAAPQPSRR